MTFRQQTEHIMSAASLDSHPHHLFFFFNKCFIQEYFGGPVQSANLCTDLNRNASECYQICGLHISMQKNSENTFSLLWSV